jgi:hypothetical protein
MKTLSIGSVLLATTKGLAGLGGGSAGYDTTEEGQAANNTATV